MRCVAFACHITHMYNCAPPQVAKNNKPDSNWMRYSCDFNIAMCNIDRFTMQLEPSNLECCTPTCTCWTPHDLLGYMRSFAFVHMLRSTKGCVFWIGMCGYLRVFGAARLAKCGSNRSLNRHHDMLVSMWSCPGSVPNIRTQFRKITRIRNRFQQQTTETCCWHFWHLC